MYTFLIVIALIISVLLILVVLVQNPKGGGLSSSFSSSNQVMGVKKTTDFLEKATWTLAIALLVVCLVINMVKPSAEEGAAQAHQGLPAGDGGGRRRALRAGARRSDRRSRAEALQAGMTDRAGLPAHGLRRARRPLATIHSSR